MSASKKGGLYTLTSVLEARTETWTVINNIFKAQNAQTQVHAYTTSFQRILPKELTSSAPDTLGKTAHKSVTSPVKIEYTQ